MTAHSTSRPSWQRDTCPPWCVVEHAETDPPDDRYHDSVTLHVPATLGPGPSHAPTTDLVLVMSRRSGELDDWVLVGEPERDGQHLYLTRDSAARVASALTALLTDSG
jgi:hypothetical protein